MWKFKIFNYKKKKKKEGKKKAIKVLKGTVLHQIVPTKGFNFFLIAVATLSPP